VLHKTNVYQRPNRTLGCGREDRDDLAAALAQLGELERHEM
jgi:hypothetical protein